MELPNKQLLRQLIDAYWVDEPNPDQEPWISSYWRLHSSEYRLELDPHGDLLSLTAAGFGTATKVHLAGRLFDEMCKFTHLTHLPGKRNILRLMGLSVVLSRVMGLVPTFDVFRQVCTLDLIQQNVPQEMVERRINFLMIGDGNGVLSSLIRSIYPSSVITLVDIGQTLLFQAFYCQRAFPECNHQLAGSNSNLAAADFLYCPVEHLDRLEGLNFDVATNLVSMQEMNVHTIERYFGFLRRNLRANNLFYCCNRESKALPDGEISTFSEYPWLPGDIHLIDDRCPWHQYYFGRTRPTYGPKLLGQRIPFINYYDGPIRHRLTVLKTVSAA